MEGHLPATIDGAAVGGYRAPVRLCLNRFVEPRRPYGPDEMQLLGGDEGVEARNMIGRWPGYAPTPLRHLPGLARTLGVAALHYKDEAQRCGLGSFKAVGGAYAVQRILERFKRERTADPARLTVTCATAGNHGRAVAWGAQQFGCSCVIFVPPVVSTARVAAIEAFGAEVRVVKGNYDDAVRCAADEARRNGWVVVSDTSYDGCVGTAREVMHGYTVLASEALEQYPCVSPLSHVFLQAGVGGLAAAVAGYLWERLGADRPQIVVVEPENADCLLRTCLAGIPQRLSGPLDTVMTGLACGEPSILAWQLLRKAADAFISIDDPSAIDCKHMLANGGWGDEPIVGGASGVAGLAGFIAAAGDPETRRNCGLTEQSSILVVGTEDDIDP